MTVYLWRAASTDGKMYRFALTGEPEAPTPLGVVPANLIDREREYAPWALAGECEGELTELGHLDTGIALYSAAEVGSLGLYTPQPI